MDKYKRTKTSGICVVCGKLVSFYANKCKTCAAIAIKGTLNPNYKGGATLKEYFCKICNKPISTISAVYSNCLCRVCVRRGKAIHTMEQKAQYRDKMKINNPMVKVAARIKLSKTMRKAYAKGRVPGYRLVKHLKYKNMSFRSSWEIVYAKWLDSKNIKWLYEEKRFNLGDSTYIPDFYLPSTDEYIEIKGFQTDTFKKKYTLFKERYPLIKCTLITSITKFK